MQTRIYSCWCSHARTAAYKRHGPFLFLQRNGIYKDNNFLKIKIQLFSVLPKRPLWAMQLQGLFYELGSISNLFNLEGGAKALAKKLVLILIKQMSCFWLEFDNAWRLPVALATAWSNGENAGSPYTFPYFVSSITGYMLWHMKTLDGSFNLDNAKPQRRQTGVRWSAWLGQSGWK